MGSRSLAAPLGVAVVLGVGLLLALNTVLPVLATIRPGGTLTGISPADAGCSGEVPAAPMHERWVCTFDDEFSGTGLDTAKWVPANSISTSFTTGPVGSQVCYFNRPDVISERDGDLNLSVAQVATPLPCGPFTTRYVGGSVSTIGTFSQTYGRFEVRARFPDVATPGLQETLWLWPVHAVKYGPRPASGEIDFAEAYSARPDRVVPYVHYVPAGADPNATSSDCAVGDVSAFHTYTLVWNPHALSMGIDGTTCLVDRWNPAPPLVRPEPFDQPFFLALTQALGVNSDAFIAGTTPLPATTSIDYVRVWTLAPR